MSTIEVRKSLDGRWKVVVDNVQVGIAYAKPAQANKEAVNHRDRHVPGAQVVLAREEVAQAC